MTMALKKRKKSKKISIIQDVERNPAVLRVDNGEASWAAAIVISNILLQKISILVEESRHGACAEKKKNIKASLHKELKHLLVQ
jgi:hypothetical protein